LVQRAKQTDQPFNFETIYKICVESENSVSEYIWAVYNIILGFWNFYQKCQKISNMPKIPQNPQNLKKSQKNEKSQKITKISKISTLEIF
jgi:hypothetical protein